MSRTTPPGPQGSEHRSRGTTARLLFLALLISGAASILVIRLAAPYALDEPLSVLVIFLAVPAVFIVGLGLLHVTLGLAISWVLPVAWLLIARDATDPILLWLIPVGAIIAIVASRRASTARPAGRLVLWGALAFAAAMVLVPVPGPPVDGPRLVIVGIDGATWDRIDPLMAEGRMPHLARLHQRGHRADLRSLLTMYSPRIWSSIATGYLPSVHGILDLGNSQADFKVGRIWDQLCAEGRPFGTVGWYFTWPPLPGLDDRSFVIPSAMAPDSTTFPPEYAFVQEIWNVGRGRGAEASLPMWALGVSAFRHGVRLSTLRRAAFHLLGRSQSERSPRYELWMGRQLSMALQADVTAELLRTRRPEFAAVLFRQVDYISHYYWKYSEPEGFPEVTPLDIELYGKAVDLAYQEIDGSLGKIVASVPEDADFMLVSDHGFRRVQSKTAGRYCRVRTESLIDVLGLADCVFGTNLDPNVFLRPTGVSPEEKEELVERLASTLERVHLAGDDSRFFDVEREPGSVRISIAPRDAIPGDARIVVEGREHPFDALVTARVEAHISGEHAPDGIYLLSGPSASRAAPVDSLHVLDIAPTAAALLDLPFAPGWPGHPAIRSGTYPEPRVAEYPLPTAAHARAPIDEALREKVRALGYLE